MEISKYLRAGHPCLYIRTAEQERATNKVLKEIDSDTALGQLKIFQWRCTVGLTEMDLKGEYSTRDPIQVTITDTLKHILEQKQEAVYIFYNIKPFLVQPAVLQHIRDVAHKLRTVGSSMIMIGSDVDIPPEIDEMVTLVEFPLPTRENIVTIFNQVVAELEDSLPKIPSPDIIEKAADCAVGMPAIKAEGAIALSLVEKKDVDFELIQAEKEDSIRKSGVMEVVRVGNTTIDDLGGFDVIKDFSGRRKNFFTKAARDYGLDAPKGILVVGLPGTGKSLMAKCVAAAMELPLYKFNVGSVFKGIVGQSEETVRRALQIAETAAPCVLLFDEFEKSIAGLEGSGRTDSGVTSRVVGTILTWMQDCQSPIFKVATCNTIVGLTGALFRKGRWDEVFGVGLPYPEEKEQILEIHLRKRGRDPKNFDLEALADEAKQFVGAELEAAVVNAMYVAFDDGQREVTTADIMAEIKSTVPLAKTDKANMEAFRDWVQDHAKNASIYAEDQKAPAGAEKGRKVRTDGARRRRKQAEPEVQW